MDSGSGEGPCIPPTKSVAEFTVMAFVLGAILSIVMGAANVYLGLKVGMTVSASIPAAVISTAILRGVFRRGTILENNIVQTMASTGESLAAGAIFTIPALILVGSWQEFKFWPTTLIVLLGGLLGIVFMVPLRRALIVERPDLIYPEGLACSEVLIAGQKGGSGVRFIVFGLAIGAAFKFLASGLHLIRGAVEVAMMRGKSIFYTGSDMSVSLLAVGYIVGLRIAVLIFLGGALGWMVIIPLLGGAGLGEDPLDAAWRLWSTQVRYVGVGTMLVGGIFSIFQVRKGIFAGVAALRGMSSGNDDARARTERDLSMPVLAAIFLGTSFATLVFFDYLTGSWGVAAVSAIVMIFAAFIFVAVATYIVGLVGSSNSPVSGMTICALLMTAGVLLGCGIRGDSAILATLGVAGVVCCAACTAGDVAQDLKTGLIVGATPAKQQFAEILGAVIPAFFFAPILTILHKAYGIGTGEEGSLLAPQAALFASLTEGFFGDGELPWDMISIGVGIGIGLIIIDFILGVYGSRFRVHVMPVAVGIYLPVSMAVPIFLGGLLNYFLTRKPRSREAEGPSADHASGGILFGSGLIAGEALMGILLAIPLALGYKFTDWEGNAALSLILFAGVVLLFPFVARPRKES